MCSKKNNKAKANKPKDNKTTISSIAKKLQHDSEEQSKDCIAQFSSRTIERMFVKGLKKSGYKPDDVKVGGKYEVDVRVAEAIEATLLESVKQDSLMNKLLKDKEELITVEDIIKHFQNIMKYIEGKMAEEDRNAFLMETDINSKYSLMAIMYNIQSTLFALMENTQVYPYPHQVIIMQELLDEVLLKFEERTLIDIKEFIKIRRRLKMTEEEIESDDNCPVDEEVQLYYEKIDQAIEDFLKKNAKIAKDIGAELGDETK